MWCVAKLDQEYIGCMEDVLKIYEKTLSEHQPVICVDEKPVVLHADTRPSVPVRPGRVGRRDYEYKRCGTANVFCAVEPKAGRHFTKPTPTRKSPDVADFLLEIAPRPQVARVRRFPAGDRRQLSPGRHHSSGAGQPLHPHPQGGGGPLW